MGIDIAQSKERCEMPAVMYDGCRAITACISQQNPPDEPSQVASHDGSDERCDGAEAPSKKN